MSESNEAGGLRCAWCEALAPADATKCPACGAALAQRESIGDLVIPGVTNVDPALRAFDERPHTLHATSPSQSAATGLIVAAALGGPLGIAIIGGLAATAAVEYRSASQRDRAETPDPEDIGRPSGAVQQAFERLERGETLGDDDIPPA
jgi:RNA polymerase subunit RPABC4/transcription elongation factor Spt4